MTREDRFMFGLIGAWLLVLLAAVAGPIAQGLLALWRGSRWPR
jgi:hypothetical protein